MKIFVRLLLATMLGAGALSLTACRDDDKAPGDKAIENMKDAGEDVGDKVEDAGDKAEDAVD